jgi:hypothetical protein
MNVGRTLTQKSEAGLSSGSCSRQSKVISGVEDESRRTE